MELCKDGGNYDHVVWCQRRDEQRHPVLVAVVEGSTEEVREHSIAVAIALHK